MEVEACHSICSSISSHALLDGLWVYSRHNVSQGKAKVSLCTVTFRDTYNIYHSSTKDLLT